MPKVSIVLPTYNGEKYLRESIDSVISQTFSDAILMNIQIHDYTHYNKCHLNYETYDTMCYAVHVLQDHFRRIIDNVKMSFLSDENMLKYIKMILHSLHYVNINFIE